MLCKNIILVMMLIGLVVYLSFKGSKLNQLDSN